MEAFARDFTAITDDQRGAGRSDHPDGPYSIELVADAIPGAELRIVLGGYSLSETETGIFNRIKFDFLAGITSTAA